jgi:SH3 domain-containing YSC84-like protein 1
MRMTGVALSLCAGMLATGLPAAETAQERLHEASQVFTEIMSTPDKGIPEDLLEKANCVVIVPGLKKAAFVVGGQYGRGFAVCRKTSNKGWGDPAAIRVEGGSFGFQIGGSSTDVVMLVMNQGGMNKLMQSKFTLGGDASVAAGPIGRTASANTDAYMSAEILSWSRARGLFAGVALNGATLRPDEDENAALYGNKMTTRQVIEGSRPVPASAKPLIAKLNNYSYREGGSNADRTDTTNKATRRERQK